MGREKRKTKTRADHARTINCWGWRKGKSGSGKKGFISSGINARVCLSVDREEEARNTEYRKGVTLSAKNKKRRKKGEKMNTTGESSRRVS